MRKWRDQSKVQRRAGAIYLGGLSVPRAVDSKASGDTFVSMNVDPLPSGSSDETCVMIGKHIRFTLFGSRCGEMEVRCPLDIEASNNAKG